MKRFTVTYLLGEVEKQVIIEAENLNGVLVELEQREPDAHNIKIEPINEQLVQNMSIIEN